MNILFVCSRNKWRSHTAEAIFKDSQIHEVRSGGTATDARIRVNDNLINWADLIFVMEKRHKQILQEKTTITEPYGNEYDYLIGQMQLQFHPTNPVPAGDYKLHVTLENGESFVTKTKVRSY